MLIALLISNSIKLCRKNIIFQSLIKIRLNKSKNIVNFASIKHEYTLYTKNLYYQHLTPDEHKNSKTSILNVFLRFLSFNAHFTKNSLNTKRLFSHK